MSGPTNRHYIVAVNSDDTYPLLRTSHVKKGLPHPEVQNGRLVVAHTEPDGQIIPDTIQSLYLSGKKWSDIQNMTWQEVLEHYAW